MKELIKIREENGQQLVSARELYEGLKYDLSTGNFNHWIEKQLENVDAIENVDFSFLKTESTGGRPSIDYAITLDIAKEICMIIGAMPRTNEETKILSKEYRKYFINCEKKLKILQDPYKGLSKELQSIFAIDKKQQEIETKLNNLEDNMPLFNIDCEELQSKVKKIATKVLGGYKSPAYLDKSIRSKVYSDIQGQLRREFGLKSYKAIRRKELGQALNIVENYKAPLYLENEIVCLNNQIGMEV